MIIFIVSNKFFDWLSIGIVITPKRIIIIISIGGILNVI